MNKTLSGSRKLVLAAAALSITVQVLPAQPSFAVGLKKSTGMQTPINLKLDEATPDTTLIKESPVRSDLAPLTLNSDTKTEATASDTNGSATLNASVSENEFAPKGPAGAAVVAPPISVKADSATDKLINDARKTHIMPLALMESRDEADKKVEARFEAEKAQLTDLWNATLTRSPDIQFVTQKLLPTSAPSHAASLMMRALSTAMIGAVNAAYFMSPSPGTAMMSSSGAQMIAQVLGAVEKDAAKKARLSETETIMLYNMVRNNADKLVENYRNYKKNMGQLRIAETDLIDLQAMAKEAKLEGSELIKTEYTLRKAQRELSGIMDDVRKFRQCLTDLAGSEAIAKLDKQLDEERLAIDPTLAEAQKEGLASAEPDAAKQLEKAKADLEAEIAAVEAAAKAEKSAKAPAVVAGAKPVKVGATPSATILHN